MREVERDKIDNVGRLTIKPEEAVGEYATSKKQNQYEVKAPNIDSPGDDIELYFIQTMREHDKFLELQKNMLAKNLQQRSLNLSRNEIIFKKCSGLRRKFLSCNAFIKDCREKSTLAKKEIAKATKTNDTYRKGIAEKQINIVKIKAFANELRKTIDEYEPYEKVLNEVVENSNLYENTQDLLTRCDASMLAQMDIVNMTKEKLGDMTENQKTLSKIIKAVALEILGLKNTLIEVGRAYTRAQNECVALEKRLNLSYEVVNKNNGVKASAIYGIFTLYRLLRIRRGLSVRVQRDKIIDALTYIKDEVFIINATYEKLREMRTSKE